MPVDQNAAALMQVCRSRGLRSTANLASVLSALVELNGHPDIDGLRARVHESGRPIFLASLYRVVKQLIKVGVIEARHFDGEKTRYELTRSHDHGHLVDVDTGQIIEFDEPEFVSLSDGIAARHGYRIVRRRVEFYVVRMGEAVSPVGSPEP